MNLRTRKKLLKAFTISQFIFLGLSFVSILALCIIFITSIKQTDLNLDNAFLIQYIIIPCVYLIFRILYVTVLTTYLALKKRQNKEQFFIYKVFYRTISILDIIIDGPFAIFFILAAFWKDDGKEEFVKQPKQTKKQQEKKKLKQIEHNLEPSNKEKLQKLKADKRKGVISEEKYNKEYKKLLKQDNINKDIK